MLTIKQITDNTEEVIRGLEKKHFKDAKATIEQVLAFNDKRRSTQIDNYIQNKLIPFLLESFGTVLHSFLLLKHSLKSKLHIF